MDMLKVFDTLRNLVSGLGTAKDKASADQFYYQPIMRPELEAMYRGDWIARQIVDCPVSDGTREWRTWQAEDDQAKLLEAAERKLRIREKVAQAWGWGRLYGGAGLILGDGALDPREPLDVEKIGRDGLAYVHVASRYTLTAGAELDTDLLSEWYGYPKFYQLAHKGGQAVDIHPSRVIIFEGAPVPDISEQMQGWTDSVLQPVRDAVKNAALATSGVAALIHEAKVDVIKIPGLMDQWLGNEESTKRLTSRFTYANLVKSMQNSIVLDAEEDWNSKQVNFSGLPDLVQLYLQIAAGAADIPATRLLGQTPTGLNNTGEGDLRNYYDRVSGEQNTVVSPALERLDEALIRHALGDRPDEITYEWAPLWQPTEKERAETAYKRAQSAEILNRTGLIPSEALAKALQAQMSESGDWPGLDQALAESEETLNRALEAEPDPLEEGREVAIETPQDSLRAIVRPITDGFIRDARPRSLYVSRRVLNADEIRKHFATQGLKGLIEASDMHVTVAFSRKPVDWFKVGESWSGSNAKGELIISAGGPRTIEEFDGGAVVQEFASSELFWRHDRIKEAGGSWDHEEYRPHITLTYGEAADLESVTPWTGKIILGPEIFEEVVEDWKTRMKES